ncbi:MAG: ArsR/SmtB family transcription factor [Ktedonobacterales bacterium]
MTSNTIENAIEHVQGDVFTAIAHPVRRQILDRLAQGEESVTHLAEPFDMSRPAVSQHLRVLRDAGLVAEERHGRERLYRLQPERLYEVRAWMRTYDRFWQTHLASLGAYLDRTEAKEADG